MRILSIILLFVFHSSFYLPVRAQEINHQTVNNSKLDTNQVIHLLDLANSYYFSKPDSCVILAKRAIALSQKIKFKEGELAGLSTAGEALRFLGEFPQALEMQFKALQMIRKKGDVANEGRTLGFIGFIYVELNEFRQGLNYLFQAKKIYDTIPDSPNKDFITSNIGNAYEKLNMLDSAELFQKEAYANPGKLKHGNLKVLMLTRLGIVYERKAEYKEAMQYYFEALQNAFRIHDQVNPSKIESQISGLYAILNKHDSAMYYARLALTTSQKSSQKLQTLDASNLLVKLFRGENKPDSVIHYQDIAIALNDSLFGPKKFRQLQLLALTEQERQQTILQDQERYRNRIKIFGLLVLLLFFLVIAIIFYRNIRNKQKVNAVLRNQKDEIEKTLLLLKSTQGQLVQSEKMASLGELTAGIAHEIQNPLNFVNNFSELNTELIDELQRGISLGNFSEVKTLASDIKENEEKINHHGKRAEAIVKGMLQHSRTNAGQKEPIGINDLVEEYLNLSYHGFRANDKPVIAGQPGFNATIHTDFDMGLSSPAGKINVIPQEIGRVLLNLFNNAFFSMREKKLALDRYSFSEGRPNKYQATISVTTKDVQSPRGKEVEILIRDNGNGILPGVLDKIFQPFFTTKPPGQGTGLGLSLSYDIITKQHGGILKTNSKAGEFAEFIILLPA